jgi:hypothetical protein
MRAHYQLQIGAETHPRNSLPTPLPLLTRFRHLLSYLHCVSSRASLEFCLVVNSLDRLVLAGMRLVGFIRWNKEKGGKKMSLTLGEYFECKSE